MPTMRPSAPRTKCRIAIVWKPGSGNRPASSDYSLLPYNSTKFLRSSSGGMFSVTTPRNDGSVGRGQWDLRGAYKYFGEAYGGYHFNVNHGLNVDAGIFVSYIGLFSYWNFDNWAYQP